MTENNLTLDEAIDELEDGDTNNPRFWEAIQFSIDVLNALSFSTD